MKAIVDDEDADADDEGDVEACRGRLVVVFWVFLIRLSFSPTAPTSLSFIPTTSAMSSSLPIGSFSLPPSSREVWTRCEVDDASTDCGGADMRGGDDDDDTCTADDDTCTADDDAC